MNARQVSNVVKLAVRRSPFAPTFRKLFRRTPLTPAINYGHNEGWDEAARWLLSSQAQHIIANPELHRNLRYEINVDIDTEFLLTALRKELLFSEPKFLESSDIQEMLGSLIWQSINNEYVWFQSTKEGDRLAKLKQQVHNAGPTTPVEWAAVACITMYLRPNELCRAGKDKEALLASISNTPDWLKYLLDVYLTDYEEEQKLKESIPHFRNIKNTTSKIIAENYEEYPYPRWIRLEASKPPPRRDRLARFFESEELGFLDQPFHVLVAGCGTGNKAIEYAMSYGDKAQVLAIDLSTTSLAYATRMARKHKVTNIRFMQMDLLDLEKLDATFDIVECTGVLHHMNDPLAGGRAIVSRVRKDGIVHISLYSELARRQIVRFREKYHLGADMTNDQIRAYRHRMMINDQEAIDERLSLRWDFFDLNRCKDLLFHPLEHRFTLPQIAGFLNDLNLEFRGLEKPSIVRSQYWTHYPPEDQMHNLDAWHQFELKHPDAFGGLYEIWSRKLG